MDRPDDTIQNTQSDDLEVVDLRESQSDLSTKKFLKIPSLKLFSKKLSSSDSKKFYQKRWFIITSVILAIIISVLGYTAYRANQIVASLKLTKDSAFEIARGFETRDLELAKSSLESTRTNLNKSKDLTNTLSFYSYLPIIKNYWADGQHLFTAADYGLDTVDLLIGSTSEYADLLGFEGAESALEFQSAEERIIFVAETVEKLAPQIDEISLKLEAINSEIDQIDENRYPKSIMGRAVRPNIIIFKDSVASLSTSLSQFKPIISMLPELLGNPEPIRYLILFQNDAELRPTGGFMTAYATITLNNGKIEPGVSEDIYTLDSAFKRNVPAPDPIRKYLPLVYNWNLRDMNLSPDFKLSMDTFTKYYNEVSIAPDVDGIIAIDTEFPVRLLEITGPIGVPGYGGQFTAENDERCDCPQVIYELENIITRPTYEIREGRKSILGPLMNSLLANMMGSPRSKWPQYFQAFSDSIQEKHLLMYFFDEEKQTAVEALHAAGRINSYDGDYLHINDTNFAGAKSNLFVEQEVIQDISVNDDGTLTKKLSLTYRNPAPPSNCNLEAGQLCLNGVLRDWIRIYVPKGSTLVSSEGSEVEIVTSEDLGKTVFEGFFTLAPESVKKLEFTYTTPKVVEDNYRLLIQKQPGLGTVEHTITVNGEDFEYSINKDTEVFIPLN